MRWRWIIGGVLVAHGLIHALGFVWAWDLAEVAELGGPTFLIPGLEPGHPAITAFGVLWLVAMVTFVAAGVAAAARRRWWPTLAGIAAGISLVPSVVWWHDANVGAMLSAVILLGVVIFDPEPTRQAADLDRGRTPARS